MADEDKKEEEKMTLFLQPIKPLTRDQQMSMIRSFQNVAEEMKINVVLLPYSIHLMKREEVLDYLKKMTEFFEPKEPKRIIS